MLLLSASSCNARREAEGVTLPWFEDSHNARLVGLRGVALMRGEERNPELRRKTNLLFLALVGCCSGRGEAGARKIVLGRLGDVGLGLNALERASGDRGELGEPCGDFAP